MQIDPRSPEHPCKQAAAQLRNQIERGQITTQLPSITELTAQTGLAVGTVRRAIDILVKGPRPDRARQGDLRDALGAVPGTCSGS
jgi:DNA-binding GntR family transcriptional regulator